MIIKILPSKSLLSVKNKRHHKMFKIPFIINSTKTDFGKVLFFSHKESITPNDI